MKKLIYSAAIIVCAAMVTACCGKKDGISTGNRFQMDSLSYSMGLINSYSFDQNLADTKLNWEIAAEEAIKALTSDDSETAMKMSERAQKFMLEERISRLQAQAKYEESDSLKQNPIINYDSIDIFADEAERKEISEAIGYDMGANLKDMNVPIQTYWFKKGILDGVAEEAPHYSFAQCQAYIQHYFVEELPKKNKAESLAWLAEVEKRSGVKKTESGLLYLIEEEGDQNLKPTAHNIVKVNYEGRIKSGKIFDSSYERGEPTEFPLNGVITGWTEGLQLIGQGGKITLWIPSELAYGERGAGALIGPNVALEFKVELLEVKPGKTQSGDLEPAEKK